MDIYTAYEQAYKNGFNDGVASIKVKHAFWQEVRGKEYCSECGKEKLEGLDAEIYSYWNIPYCPHCGAKIVDF